LHSVKTLVSFISGGFRHISVLKTELQFPFSFGAGRYLEAQILLSGK